MKKVLSTLIELVIFAAMFYILKELAAGSFIPGYWGTLVVVYITHSLKSQLVRKIYLESLLSAKINSQLKAIDSSNYTIDLIVCSLGVAVIQLFAYPAIVFNLYPLTLVSSHVIIDCFALSAVYILILEVMMEPLFLHGMLKKIEKEVTKLAGDQDESTDK